MLKVDKRKIQFVKIEFRMVNDKTLFFLLTKQI